MSQKSNKSNHSAKMVRQGDVLLLPVSAPTAAEVEEMPKDSRGLVVAEGETSGHFHALFGPGAKLVRYKATPGRVIARLEEGGEIRVIGGGAGGIDRHTPISLQPGNYEIRIQRSWTSANASRQVSD